jgi:flagellar biosynthesis protein FlhG
MDAGLLKQQVFYQCSADQRANAIEIGRHQTMTVTISVGSGKGGTGKSMVVANIGLLLAKAGRSVCVADLDLGGADIHILYGVFKPEFRLTDFLNRKVESLGEIILPLSSFGNLQIIAGSGDTLRTANMSFQEKQRLLRGLSSVDTDVLILDVGAGTGYHALDFFMFSDIQICVTNPEPTAVMDFYNFLQLATLRKALSSFLSQSEISRTLKERNFQTLTEVFALAEGIQPGSRKRIQQALDTFNPLLITNMAGSNAKINRLKLKKLASKYLGISIPDLGEIPYDTVVKEALRAYLPVCEHSPKSPASLALAAISTKLEKVIDLFNKKRIKPEFS